MDPSVCYNPTFIFPLDEDESPIVEHEDIESRLLEAAKRAEKLLSSTLVYPALEIDNEKGCSIVVKDTIDNDVPYLLIHRDAQHNKPLLKIPHDKFRYIYFRHLSDCRIFIKCKTLKLMFQKCDNCQISMREPVISIVEFFQCTQTNIVLRIPIDPIQQSPPIPLIRIEECSQTYVFQSNDVLYYIVKSSPTISGTIVDGETGERIAKYNLGSRAWSHPSEQDLVYLSRTDGFASVPMIYALNDIGHHLYVQTPDEADKDPNDICIVGTPEF